MESLILYKHCFRWGRRHDTAEVYWSYQSTLMSFAISDSKWTPVLKKKKVAQDLASDTRSDFSLFQPVLTTATLWGHVFCQSLWLFSLLRDVAWQVRLKLSDANTQSVYACKSPLSDLTWAGHVSRQGKCLSWACLRKMTVMGLLNKNDCHEPAQGKWQSWAYSRKMTVVGLPKENDSYGLVQGKWLSWACSRKMTDLGLLKENDCHGAMKMTVMGLPKENDSHRLAQGKWLSWAFPKKVTVMDLFYPQRIWRDRRRSPGKPRRF